jgi:DNA polymerase III delta subunit
MIYLIYGNKDEEIREKVRSIVATQVHKKPDALQFRVTRDNWKDTSLDELLGGQGLFVQKYIVVFDHLLREKGEDEREETLLKRLTDFAESEHFFIFVEGDLTKEILKKFEKKAEKIQELSFAEKKLKEKFNIFSLADALGGRNKKSLWVLYQEAIMAGVVPEEIHPILFWQLRAMLASSQSRSALEAGLSPYVYSKASRFADNFSNEELRNLSSKLVTLYHDTRRGLVEFDTEMEKFILAL